VTVSSAKQQLQTDLTEAMRQRDTVTVATLRMALSSITTAEVAGDEAVELDDAGVLAVLRSEAKKRAEAAEIYDGAGRTELAAKERAELAVLERYLPAAMSDADLAAVVAEEVAAAGATDMKAMGAVIKAVRARVGDGADGARISAAVKAALA
jgi:uncharacterized protein